MKNIRNQAIIYQTKSGSIELKGDIKKETLWANLQQIADLFETDKSGISRHISNIYQTNELEQKSTVAKIATVQKEQFSRGYEKYRSEQNKNYISDFDREVKKLINIT